MRLPRAFLAVPLGLLLAFVGAYAGCCLFPNCPTGNGGCSGLPLVACPDNELTAAGPDCNFCCIQAAKSCSTGDAGDPCCSGACGDGGLCTCGEADAPCHGPTDCCSGSCVEDACVAGDAGVDGGMDAGADAG